jgi:hypothetical protein
VLFRQDTRIKPWAISFTVVTEFSLPLKSLLGKGYLRQFDVMSYRTRVTGESSLVIWQMQPAEVDTWLALAVWTPGVRFEHVKNVIRSRTVGLTVMASIYCFDGL